MPTETITIETVKKSSTWIEIPSGTKFYRLNSNQNISKFLFKPWKTSAISVMQGDYIFAFENHLWSVPKHEVKEINKCFTK